MIFFLSFFLKIYCACIKSWSVRHFLSITCHFIFFVLCMHASYNTSSEMLNIKFISKRLRNMGDRWEARLSAMENIQEKFEHNIREIEEQLARLTSLFENMAVHPRGPSPLPHQQVPRPSVQTTNYLPHRTDRPNLRQSRPTAPPAFVATSRHVDQPSSSRGKPSRRKIDKDKLR